MKALVHTHLRSQVMRLTTAASVFAFALLEMYSTHAAVLYVPDGYSTIQAAINAAIDGDEIVVSPGTYVENISILGRNIFLRSENPDDLATVESTIIDGNQAGSVIIFSGTETSACVLSGFTITNGLADFGGGINGRNGQESGTRTLATITKNLIVENTVGQELRPVYAAGAGIFGCRGLIAENIIARNEAVEAAICEWYDGENHCTYYGGDGAGLCACNGTIKNNVIIDNEAWNDGGAIWVCYTATIRGNIVRDNGAWNNIIQYCDGVIEENTITENFGGTYGTVLQCDGFVVGNVIVGNENDAVQSCGVDGGVEGNFFSRNGGFQIYGCSNVTGNVITDTSEFVGLVTSCDRVLGNIVSANGTLSVSGVYGVVWGCTDVINNVIVYNRSYYSGVYECSGLILGNTICFNTIRQPLGGGGIGETPYGSHETTITNNILWGNTSPAGVQIVNSAAATYCCIENDTSGEPTNISVDPGLMDPEHGDFSLRPDSPCVDAGAYYAAAALDIIGRARGFDGTAEPRGDGSDFDIGAYEYVVAAEGEGEGEGEGEITYHKADQNSDGHIVLAELLRVIQLYNSHGYRCVPGTVDGYAPGLSEAKARGLAHASARGLAHASPRFAGETCLSPTSTTLPEGVGDRHVGLEDSPACASPLGRTEEELFAERRKPRKEPSPVPQWREERRKKREEERILTQRRRERGEEGRISRSTYNPVAKSPNSLVAQYMAKYEVALPEIPEESLALWELAKSRAAVARAKGETVCVAHSSDYKPQDWSISITELMRAIQFYNTPVGYAACAYGEDGFCPVVAE